MPSPSVGQAAALAADVFSFTDPSDDYLLVPSFSSFSTSKEIEMRIAQVESQREAAQREHEARQRSTNAARAAAKAKEDRMRAQQRHQAEEAEKQRRRRAAATRRRRADFRATAPL